MLGCACGRVGFEPTGGDSGTGTRDGGTAGDARDASVAGQITWVRTVVGRNWPNGTTDTFAVRAHAAGDAFLFAISCVTTIAPTAATLTAPGWTIAQLDPIAAASSGGFYVASFAAVAPDTSATTFTLTWTAAAGCTSGSAEIGDEFAMNDPTGGATTFDAHALVVGTGTCIGSVTTGHANDAIWAACHATSGVGGVGSGYIKATDDADGDWSEYKITTDPSGTVEQPTFVESSAFILAVAAIKPQ